MYICEQKQWIAELIFLHKPIFPSLIEAATRGSLPTVLVPIGCRLRFVGSTAPQLPA